MEENSNSDEASGRLVSRRRLVAFVAGFVVYVAVLVLVASEPTDTTYTTHTFRYLVLVALFYSFLSGVNFAHGYVSDSTLHEDTSDFAGGISVVVGLGVFYSEVLGTGAGTGTEGANVFVLAFVTAATVAGMLLILRL